MHQTKLSSGQTVDLGPNWIHGTDHNPILDLAKETGTATHLWGEKVNIFDENGDLLPDGRELGDTMWSIIVQAFKHSGKNTSHIESKESLYDFFVEKLQEIVPSGEEAERKRKVVLQLAEFWGAFVGSPVTKQSLKFFWLEECIDGGMWNLCLLFNPWLCNRMGTPIGVWFSSCPLAEWLRVYNSLRYEKVISTVDLAMIHPDLLYGQKIRFWVRSFILDFS